MEALDVEGRAEYERVLLGPGDELQALVEEIVIPESWFFRDDRPFEALREHARTWLGYPARPPLSALSIPCAGGEEPYSIAIALAEVGLPASRFRVDAAEVSARSLERAIAGVYGPNSFRGPAAAIRPKFFREQGGRYSVDSEVRKSVRFRAGNLLDPRLVEGDPPFDVVFCRNLLIYFDAPSRAKAFGSLARLTADGGLLFLGHADRGDESPTSPFRPLAARGTFAYRKGPAEVAPPRAPSARPKPRATAEPARPRPAPEPVTPPAPPAPPAETPAEILARASSLADRGRYDEAGRLVERAVARAGPSARASSLLGLIRQAAGDLKGAEAHFLRAVYLDPLDDEALLALALLAGRRGDAEAEAGYRRRLARALSRKEAR